MNLFNLFKKRQPKPEPPKLVFRGDSSAVTISQYRENSILVSEAQSLMHDPRFQRMIEVVRNSSPAFVSFAQPVDLAQRAMMQCRIEGYNQAVKSFEALGKLVTKLEPIRETYEEEENPENLT